MKGTEQFMKVLEDKNKEEEIQDAKMAALLSKLILPTIEEFKSEKNKKIKLNENSKKCRDWKVSC